MNDFLLDELYMRRSFELQKALFHTKILYIEPNDSLHFGAIALSRTLEKLILLYPESNSHETERVEFIMDLSESMFLKRV